MDLFTHEQYFWPFYHNYVPDHPHGSMSRFAG